MWVSIKGSTLEKGRTNGSDLVGKVLLAPGSSSYGPPPVDDELVTSGGGLALRNDVRIDQREHTAGDRIPLGG
jgi:hypothetical protein